MLRIIETGKIKRFTHTNTRRSLPDISWRFQYCRCEDADIEKASNGAVKGRFINCGQSCIASKRFIAVKKISNEFIEKFTQKAEKLKVGDPMSDDTDIGPLVNAEGLNKIDSIVKDVVKEGAEVLTGGERIKSKGYFYKPTVLKNVSPKMRVAREVFGPMAPIMVADDDMQAINLANDSQYGLGASIWTEDLDKAEKLSRMVQSGVVSVNNIVTSNPRVNNIVASILEFHLEVSRKVDLVELSRYGMLEFVNIKSVRFYDQLVHQHHVE